MSEVDERAVAMLSDLPWPPGQSPYGIKGVAYRGHVEYCERFVPGGHAAVLAALGRPDLDAFFAQAFLASTRYDVFPLALIGLGAARVTGVGFLDFVRERSRWQANEDVHGVYRWLLRLTSPEMIAARLPRLIAQYFDFGDAAIDVVEKGHLRTIRRGLPRPLAEWYAAVSMSYLEVLIGLAGGQGVHCTVGEITLEGRAHGIDVVSMEMEAWWT